MKTLEFAYGKETQTLHLQDGELKAVIECDPVADTGRTDEEIIREALENPIGSPRLRDLAKGIKKLLVITSDHTRPLPSRITLPMMIAEVRSVSPDVDVTVLVACGTHRATTEAELRAKFGDDFVDREHVVVHQGATSPVTFKGILPSGGECIVNSLTDDADLIISDGYIEAHGFAGFSGGRKSVLPGISSAVAIRQNHCAKLLGDCHTRNGVVEGNLVHRDMLVAAKLAGLRFIHNVILYNKKVVAAFAGDLEEAHAAGCAYSKKLLSKKVVYGDIVVTSNSGYPLDQNVYQTVKCLITAETCVNQGGVIIAVSKCSDGGGGDDFINWFLQHDSVEEVAHIIDGRTNKETTQDQWQAQMLSRVLLKARIIMVADEANKELLEKVGFIYCKTVDEAYAKAKTMVKDPAVVAIPNGVSVIIDDA